MAVSWQCKTLPCERRPRYRYLIFTKYNIVMSCSHRHNLLPICNYRGMIAYGAGQCVIFFFAKARWLPLRVCHRCHPTHEAQYNVAVPRVFWSQSIRMVAPAAVTACDAPGDGTTSETTGSVPKGAMNK